MRCDECERFNDCAKVGGYSKCPKDKITVHWCSYPAIMPPPEDKPPIVLKPTKETREIGKQLSERFGELIKAYDAKMRVTPWRIIRNGPATIVIWMDGTKTIVKKSADTPDDDYSAFCAALAKKIYGNNSRIHKIVAKTEKQG